MLNRITKFKVNGWVVLVAIILTSVIVNAGIDRSRVARQEAAKIITTVPVVDSARLDGTQLNPSDSSDGLAKAKVAPSTKAPRTDRYGVVTDPETGTETFGLTRYFTLVDEITGAKSWFVILSERKDSQTGVGMYGAKDKVTFTVLFPTALDTDFDRRVDVQARFTLRDGTAVVREYTLFGQPGGKTALARNEAVVQDLISLMSKSTYAAFRSRALSGDDAMVRINIDDVDWKTSSWGIGLATNKESKEAATARRIP